MAELVDALHSKCNIERCVGSSPTSGTKRSSSNEPVGRSFSHLMSPCARHVHACHQIEKVEWRVSILAGAIEHKPRTWSSILSPCRLFLQVCRGARQQVTPRAARRRHAFS